jgi:hypothetical protein
MGSGRAGPTLTRRFLLALPVVTGLFTTVFLVLLEGRAALYAGVAFGVGLVVLSGALRVRETRRSE